MFCSTCKAYVYISSSSSSFIVSICSIITFGLICLASKSSNINSTLNVMDCLINRSRTGRTQHNGVRHHHRCNSHDTTCSPFLADGLWCVAAPDAADGPLQKALDWACSPKDGAVNCDAIQETGPCYLPNTVRDHVSYAFNLYWQLHRGVNNSCDFNGLAIETSTDPST